MVQPEDDLPHIRDPLQQLGHRAALLPAQITVAGSLIAAVSQVMRAGDLLLCSAAEAADLRLTWRPLAAARVARGYRVSAPTGEETTRVRLRLAPHVARTLGPPARSTEQP